VPVPETIFQCSEISKDFDGVRALRRASLSLFPGEVHALMGENGAGKSTLAKIIAGSLASDGGSFFVDGSQVEIRGPQDAQRLGISIIYQELDLFPHLTVADNLAMGNHQFTQRGFLRSADLDRFAAPYLAQVGLACGPRCQVRSLSTGERQLVAIARALSTRARIILMDEPTSALFDDSVGRLFRLMGALKKQGVALVYVSHKLEEIFRICDRVTVMRDGETLGTRAIGEVSSAELVRMMIGKQWQARAGKPADSHHEIVLSFFHLTTAKLRDLCFDLRKGEVLGVAGLLGSGRSEIGRALMGLDRLQKGQVILGGKPVVIKSVRQALAAGLRWSPEDRKRDGLMMQMSILENGTISDLGAVSRCGFIHTRSERSAALAPFGALSLKYSSLSLPVRTLSGGNQQKVLLSRCLLGNSAVVFLDDPTRGIDVGAKEDIYQIIQELASRGKGIVLVSSELPELLRCCDRILVMREGRIAAQLDARHTTQEEILTWATQAAAPVGGAA
jgi:ABC-type sugar transport system ATPase subunit